MTFVDRKQQNSFKKYRLNKTIDKSKANGTIGMEITNVAHLVTFVVTGIFCIIGTIMIRTFNLKTGWYVIGAGSLLTLSMFIMLTAKNFSKTKMSAKPIIRFSKAEVSSLKVCN